MWSRDPRNTWFRCLCPTPETAWWDHCQHYVHRCTLCVKVDRAYDPYHSYPCCGMYGRRREANEEARTLTQVACQVARRRPCYAFMTGKVFSFLDHDPLRRMCVGLHRWVLQTLSLLEISLPMGDVCSRGRWVGVYLPRSMSFSLLSVPR